MVDDARHAIRYLLSYYVLFAICHSLSAIC